MTTVPSYDEITSLTAYAAQRIPVAFEDINGHLNIRHYIGIASEGLDESLVEVGVATDWRHTQLAVFSAEHHLTYFTELHTGANITVRVRLLGRSERAVHAVIYLVDETNQRVAYQQEEVFLRIDMATRKTAPWPAEVADKIDARIAETDRLAWKPELSGVIALR
ncbi:hypothetical protein GHK92_19885 [Nocardioides sp. dk4132]|uniref:thioesterase family protein n=1 Tax=unclassified Nocardioides TaxID=2615069 RepID=UPI001295C1FB|nr:MULTISPECIES: thioesterase family protein [unclassified Nocardioides]MQW78133.1 hypothetical protein [Nocardioides sp. dk4132]QGA09046.1 hypothetical protein GFH29_17825 [Nocardioides sp. dk884]